MKGAINRVRWAGVDGAAGCMPLAARLQLAGPAQRPPAHAAAHAGHVRCPRRVSGDRRNVLRSPGERRGRAGRLGGSAGRAGHGHGALGMRLRPRCPPFVSPIVVGVERAPPPAHLLPQVLDGFKDDPSERLWDGAGWQAGPAPPPAAGRLSSPRQGRHAREAQSPVQCCPRAAQTFPSGWCWRPSS